MNLSTIDRHCTLRLSKVARSSDNTSMPPSLDLPVHQMIKKHKSGKYTFQQLAEEYGCSVPTIYRKFKKAGYRERSVGLGAIVEIVYYIDEIRYRYDNGDSANQLAREYQVSPMTIAKYLEGTGTYIRRQHRETRRLNRAGYVVVRHPRSSYAPAMVTVADEVLEHRLVMAEHHRRPLLATETVHHKDGNKENNALDNLQLRTGNHGPGVVGVCLDCGSHNVAADEI